MSQILQSLRECFFVLRFEPRKAWQTHLDTENGLKSEHTVTSLYLSLVKERWQKREALLWLDYAVIDTVASFFYVV